MFDWRNSIQNMYKNLGINSGRPQGQNFPQAGGDPYSFYQQQTGQFSQPVSNYYGAPLPQGGLLNGPGSSGGLLDVAARQPGATPAPTPAPQPAAPDPNAGGAGNQWWQFGAPENQAALASYNQMMEDQRGGHHPTNGIPALLEQKFRSQEDAMGAMKELGLENSWFGVDRMGRKRPDMGLSLKQHSFYS